MKNEPKATEGTETDENTAAADPTPPETTDEPSVEAKPDEPSVEAKPDEPPSVAGGQQPVAPPVDPTVLGPLTPQENAALVNLRRQSQQLTLEVGKLDIQKDQIKDHIRSNDDRSQAILMQIGQRLGIPPEVTWTVGGDGNARVIPPQMLQAMKQGMPPGMMPGMGSVPAQASQPGAKPQR